MSGEEDELEDEFVAQIFQDFSETEHIIGKKRKVRCFRILVSMALNKNY